MGRISFIGKGRAALAAAPPSGAYLAPPALVSLVHRARATLLEAPDTVCLERALLVTESYRQTEGQPAPLRRAKAFAHVLRHMSLELHSNPLFAGNTSSTPRAWMLMPEHGFCADAQTLLENPSLEGLLDRHVPTDLVDYWQHRSVGGCAGVGHLAVNFRRVVHDGLQSIITEVEGHATEGSEEQQTYRQAMLISLHAVVAWSLRYAGAAELAALREQDPLVREALGRVSRACMHVPLRPARDLFEGLQAIALVHLATAIEGHGLSISIGLPDRALAHLVDNTIDTEETTALVAGFMLKIAANSFQGRGSKTQAITVGGADSHGRDCSNVLTSCFLDACDMVRVGDPHLFLRWHPGLDPRVRVHATHLLAHGLSMPLLVGDGPTVEGLIAAGIAPADAWEYCVIGCNELGVPGRSASSAAPSAGVIEHLGLLMAALDRHPDPDSLHSAREVLDILEQELRRTLAARRLRGRERRVHEAHVVPTPFASSLMHGCAERGEDLLSGMAYEIPCVYERGLVNAANALAAIEHAVFLHGRTSLSALRAALRDGDHDGTATRALKGAPAWGTDNGRADAWMRRLLEMRERVLRDIDSQTDGRASIVCHVIRSLHRLDGARVGASPDGRKAGDALADSIGAQQGTLSRGHTALLRSVLGIDAARFFRGGSNLNLTLPYGTPPSALGSLLGAFFSGGGQELQVNCIDTARLRAAQRSPGDHGDLLVRVAGFSARFVDLSPGHQEEIIARAEHAAA